MSGRTMLALPVWGVSMVRDEADIVEASVRHMAGQVDRLVVADNGSTDGTRDILARLAGELDLQVTDDPEPAYMQSEKMSRLAACAGAQGASWVVPWDADELWVTARHRCRVADLLTDETLVGPEWAVVSADVYDMVATGDDPPEPDPTLRIRWRRPDPLPLPKVAARWRPGLVIEQGNHGARYDIVPAAHPERLLNVRHYPYRSAEQMVRKVRNGHRAYEAAGDRLPAEYGAHWRAWGQLTDDQIGDVFRSYFWRATPDQPYQVGREHQPPLVHDPA